MDMRRYFADEWPRLVPGLRAALARAGAPAVDRDDLVQETATRLVGVWEQIDWDRGVDSLAYRIALNAWRDQWRHRDRREVLGEVPEPTDPANTERAALARIELDEVARALTVLPPATANVLRLAAGEAEGVARPVQPVPAALRMARTRARRALAAAARVACGFAALVAVAARVVARPARNTAALGVLATAAAFVVSVHVTGVPDRQPPSTWAARPMAVALAPSRSPVVADGRSHAGLAHARIGVRNGRVHTAAKPPPYYTLDSGGPASASVFVTLDVFGYGVQVSRPEPGDTKPLCTYGNTPSVATVSRCATH